MKQETIDSLINFINKNGIPPNMKETLADDWPTFLENIIIKAPYLLDDKMKKEIPQEMVFEYKSNYANWSPEAALRDAIKNNDLVFGALAVDSAVNEKNWTLAYEGMRQFRLEGDAPRILINFAKNDPISAYRAAKKDGRENDEKLMRLAFPYILEKDVRVAENAARHLDDNKLLSQVGYALAKKWPVDALLIAYQLQDEKMEGLCKKKALDLNPYEVFKLATGYKKDGTRKEAAERLLGKYPHIAINTGNELGDLKLRERGFKEVKKLSERESFSIIYKIDDPEIKDWLFKKVMEEYHLQEAKGLIGKFDYSINARI